MANLDPVLVGYKDIYDIDIVDEALINLQKIYTDYLNGLQITLPYLQNISFGYLDNFSINALTNVVDDRGVIAMTIYAPFILSDLFYGLLSHPSVLRDLENQSEVEKFSSYSIPKSLKELATEENGTIAIRSPRWRPETLLRNSYAAMLVNIANDFLFLHETGHLLQGHIPMRRKILKSFEPLMAFGNITDTQYSCLVNHALEYDADWFCIKYLIDFGIRNQLLTSKLAGFSETPRFLFRTLVLAIVLVMFSGDLSRYETAMYKCKTHPHPYWRFLTLYHTVDITLDELYPELKPQWKAAYYDVLIDLRYIADIYEPVKRWFSDASLMKSVLDDHFEKIVTEHSKIADILKSSPYHFLSHLTVDTEKS